ncbi:MAG: hypothetical protein KatS3mg111_1948 [Pirellulaceae bacterium]|nr:MAG: hypothetical protein KatS3mg111_1948 [Pirellulaceae bacterium]
MDDRDSTLKTVATLYEQGYYEQARDLAHSTLQQHPDDGKLWELCGLCHDALNDVAAATRALEKATLLVPLSAAGQCVLARCYAVTGHRDLARQMYRHVFSMADLPSRLLPMLAAGLGSAGDCELALQACRQAAALQLDSGQPFYGMAHYMGRLGYPLEMIANVLRRAVAIEPDVFQYRFALAVACGHLGHLEDAYHVLRPAIDAELIGSIQCVHCLRHLEWILASNEDALSGICCSRILQLTNSEDDTLLQG